MLRVSCSSKGAASAVEKRNRFGDFMGIGDSGFRALAARLAAAPLRSQLRALDLSWNHLGDGAMAALRGSWPEALSSLRLDWNSIGSEGAAHLAAALTSPAAIALRELELRSNPLCDRGVAVVCRAAAQCMGLRWLGLGETSLTDEGACAALPWLRQHPTLAGLDVGENALTDAACEAVAGVVAQAPSLRALVLRGFLFEPTRISDAGGQVLARAVARRAGLHSGGRGLAPGPFSLELDYQQVGCGTAAEMAQCHGAWSRLSLFNTEVSTMGAMSLANTFRQRPGSAGGVQLNIAQCRIGAGAVDLLRSAGFSRLDSHGQRGHLRAAAAT